MQHVHKKEAAPLSPSHRCLLAMPRFLDLPLELILDILQILLVTHLSSFLSLTSVSRRLRDCLTKLPDTYRHVYCPVVENGTSFHQFGSTFLHNPELARRVNRPTIIGHGVSRSELEHTDPYRFPAIDYATFRQIIRLFPHLEVLDIIGLRWIELGLWQRLTGVRGRLLPALRDINVCAVEASGHNVLEFARALAMLPSITNARPKISQSFVRQSRK